VGMMHDTARRLWVVSPSYRDVPSFLLLRKEVLATLDQAADVGELPVSFVVVDDTAGRDPEVDALRALPDTRVIEPPFNLGHQRAIVFALRRLGPDVAAHDLVVTMDSDGEDRAQDLPRLLAPLLEASTDVGVDDHTVVLARRTSREESTPFKLGYRVFRLAFRALTGTVIRSGNFAAYRGAVAKRLVLHPYFDLCYSSTFVALDAPIAYVPCPRGPRLAGRSRMNTSQLVLHGMRMLMPFLDRIALRALALFSAAFVAGLAMIATIVGLKLFTDRAIPGWATDTALGALILSLIALSSWLILFATFSQSRGVSLSSLDRQDDGPAA
jgi:polyisoprenyl-phosphate glycosyltransferase